MSSPIPQRTDEVVLFTNDDQHEVDRLRKAVEAAALTSETPRRIGDDPDVQLAARAYDEYVHMAAERGTKVVIRALPGRKWRALVAEHPPREKNRADEEWGFNYLTFGDAAVPACVVSIADQPLEGDAVQEAVDSMSDGDFSRLYSAVVRLNTGQGPDPKASISDLLPRTSPETSESPARLG